MIRGSLTTNTELEDLLSSLMSSLLSISQQTGNPFRTSYGVIGAVARLGDETVRGALIVLRERNVIDVQPRTEPSRMDLERAFTLRFTEEQLKVRARAAAARTGHPPRGLGREHGIINTIGDETHKRERREREEQAEKEHYQRMEACEGIAFHRAGGRCETCDKKTERLTLYRRRLGCFVETAADLVAVCPNCAEIVQRFHGVRLDDGASDD